jgi:hypothetical protein
VRIERARRGRLAAVALLVVLASIATLIASCTATLGLDGFSVGATDLCTLIAHCTAKDKDAEPAVFAACSARIEARLATAPETTTAWLGSLADKDCFASCINARRCLDLVPVCEAEQGKPCGADTDCCTFSKGHAQCLGGKCCSTKGATCEDDTECCDGAGTCDVLLANNDNRAKTCGGVRCAEPGEPCQLKEQCCTGVCLDGKCSDGCFPDAFPCTQSEQCCSKACNNGACGVPTCLIKTQPCGGSMDLPCCGGLTCNKHRVCSDQPDCSPIDADCASDLDCCSGHCDPQAFHCIDLCQETQTKCDVDAACCSGVCAPGTGTCCSRAGCNDSADCCSSGSSAAIQCIKGSCLACAAPVCVPEVNDCSLTGPHAGKANGCNDACADAICADDPFCCCVAWDARCSQEALANSSCKCP